MSHEGLELIIEMNSWVWQRFRGALNDMTREEANWRPVPEANSINLIVRHLCIESELHLASLEHGKPMPVEVTASLQQLIDSVPLEFEHNIRELEGLYRRFVTVLQKATVAGLQQHSALAYQNVPGERPTHLLSFHQAVHLSEHWGQISTIRNLYRTTRGEAARFFPDNPTFPSVSA